MATLNHIGIAVSDLPQMKKLFTLLGLAEAGTEEVPEQGVRTHFFKLPVEPASVELLEPLHEKGTVAQFIQKRGPGIHHLSFQVKKGELVPLLEKIRGEGFKLIYDQPKVGAHGMRINFIHPSTTGGVLVELMEPS